MFDPLRPHGLQHARSPCPSPTPRVHPKPTFIESVMPSNHLILCRLLLLLPSIFPSIRVFSNESALHIRWPKYWSFSFNISPSNEHSVLISFRLDWLDLHREFKGLSRIVSNTTVQNQQSFGAQFLYSPTLTSIQDHWKNVTASKPAMNFNCHLKPWVDSGSALNHILVIVFFS